MILPFASAAGPADGDNELWISAYPALRCRLRLEPEYSHSFLIDARERSFRVPNKG